ncbi:MAG: hypothetical protein ACHRXM_19105 [Isosphaerales bacterium]
MAEENPRDRSKPDPEPQIGTAELLFRDGPAGTSPKHAPNSSAAPGSGAGEVFDLVEQPGSVDPTVSIPIPRTPAAREKREASKPRGPRTERPENQSDLDPSELVEEVWSRTAEWGQTLIVVGGWLAISLLVVYFLLDVHLGLAFLALLLGGAVAVVLSYPILITLERPVRITPEQAVRDYYAALSHHVPHFKRMWLLLSRAGRVSTAFGSFEGFKAYWKDRLGRMREGHAGSMTPLVFNVADFKADKSAGMFRIDADFTVKVSVRGRRQAGPIDTYPMRIALVRGPDKMWYLEDGTLTRRERAMKPSDS